MRFDISFIYYATSLRGFVSFSSGLFVLYAPILGTMAVLDQSDLGLC